MFSFRLIVIIGDGEVFCQEGKKIPTARGWFVPGRWEYILLNDLYQHQQALPGIFFYKMQSHILKYVQRLHREVLLRTAADLSAVTLPGRFIQFSIFRIFQFQNNAGFSIIRFYQNVTVPIAGLFVRRNAPCTQSKMPIRIP